MSTFSTSPVSTSSQIQQSISQAFNILPNPPEMVYVDFSDLPETQGLSTEEFSQTFHHEGYDIWYGECWSNNIPYVKGGERLPVGCYVGNACSYTDNYEQEVGDLLGFLQDLEVGSRICFPEVHWTGEDTEWLLGPNGWVEVDLDEDGYEEEFPAYPRWLIQGEEYAAYEKALYDADALIEEFPVEEKFWWTERMV